MNKRQNKKRIRYVAASLRKSLERGGGDRLTLVLILGGAGLSFFAILPQSVAALIVSMGAVRAFVMRLDLGLPLAQIAALLACMQWLVGPSWYYIGDYHHNIMGMVGSAEDYFSYATPGTAAFVSGLLVFGHSLNQKEMLATVERRHFFFIGLVLSGVSLAGDLAGRFGPSGLAFAFFLISQLRYVGVLYLWFSPQTGSRWLAGVAMLPLFISTADSAMFHDMLLWCGLLFCFWFASRSRTRVYKLVVLVTAIFLIFTIQGVKQSFRAKVWKGESSSLTMEILNFWSNFTEFDQAALKENALLRLNQGWIISRVMEYVPSAEPFARGETVKNAVIAAVAPRFLLQDKALAGGRSNFLRFTGLPINESTSMNISLLGEGYANFGSIGGTCFLFGIGLLISFSISICLQWSRRNPLFIFWIPLIFYQAIKAETDLTEILNQITKGGIVAFSCFLLIEMLYPTRLKSRFRVIPKGGRKHAKAKIGQSKTCGSNW